MNISETITALRTIFDSPYPIRALLLGPPGCGKTSAVEQAASMAANPLDFLCFHLPSREAVDLLGLPQVVNGRTIWASPMPRGGRGVLLLDELSSAPKDVQVAAHHILHAEKGSDMSLPPEWHIVATGNRASDHAVAPPLTAPLRNRLVILDVEVSVQSWIDWAQASGINPWLIGFFRWRPEMLIAKEIPSSGAFNSPRSWECVSKLLSMSFTATTEREMITGSIGQGAAVEFMAYLRTARELPTIQSILENPKKANVPTSPSVLYALVSSLGHHTRQTLQGAMEYVQRLPAEHATLYINDIRNSGYNLRNDNLIRKFIGDHPHLFSFSE